MQSSDNTPTIGSSLATTPATVYPTWRSDYRQLFASKLRNRYVNYGMLHLVLTPAEWALLPGNLIAGQARPMPNPEPPGVLAGNATNAAVAIYKAEEELCNIYRQNAADCREALITSLGPSLRERFGNPLVADTITMSSLEIVTAVHQLYGVRTAVDLKTIEDSMKDPLVSPDLDSFQKFSQMFAKNVRSLNMAGQPLSNHSQLDQFERLIAHHDQPLKAMRLYIEANPLLVNRNLAGAITAIEVHLSNVTTAGVGYAAPMVAAAPLPTTFAGSTSSMSHSDLTKIVDLLLTKLGSSTPSGTTPGGGGISSGRHKKTKAAHHPTPYCYFHGFMGHDGAGCKKMKADNSARPNTFTAPMLHAKTPTDVAGGHP